MSGHVGSFGADGRIVHFTCNGDAVEVDAAPGESLLLGPARAARRRLGEGRLRAAGPVRLLHRAGRRRAAGRVRHAGRRGSRTRSVTTVDGLDPGGARSPRRRVRGDGRVAVRVLHARDPRAGVGAARQGRAERASTSTARSPRTSAGAPAGRRLRGDRHDGRRTAPVHAPRDLDAAARRAELEGGVAQQVGPEVPLGDGGLRRRHRATRRAGRGPAPPGSPAPTVEAAGRSWVVAESLRRRPRARGQGAGAAHDGRRAPPLPLAAAPARRRAPRDELGRARVPRARRVVVRAGRRAGDAARQRRRVRRQGGVARAGRPRASSPTELGRAVRVVYSPGGRRAARTEAAADRGQRACCDGDGRLEARSSSDCPCGAPARRTPSTLDVDWTRRPRSPSTRWACSRGRARRGSGARSAARSRDDGRDLAVLARHRGSRCPTASAHGAGARVARRPGVRARSSGSRCASPPATRSTRSCCVPTASAPRTWRSAGCCTEGLAVDPETGEVHDLTIRSFGVIRAEATRRRSTSRSSTTPVPPRPRASDAVFAAVAAATWNAVTDAEGTRPEVWPARATAAARALRRYHLVWTLRRAMARRASKRTTVRRCDRSDRVRGGDGARGARRGHVRRRDLERAVRLARRRRREAHAEAEADATSA